MKCPKCGDSSQVLRSYSVDELGTTQDRLCSGCGYRSTTVIMELRDRVSAYRARSLIRAQQIRLIQIEAEKKGKK